MISVAQIQAMSKAQNSGPFLSLKNEKMKQEANLRRTQSRKMWEKGFEYNVFLRFVSAL